MNCSVCFFSEGRTNTFFSGDARSIRPELMNISCGIHACPQVYSCMHEQFKPYAKQILYECYRPNQFEVHACMEHQLINGLHQRHTNSQSSREAAVGFVQQCTHRLSTLRGSDSGVSKCHSFRTTMILRRDTWRWAHQFLSVLIWLHNT